MKTTHDIMRERLLKSSGVVTRDIPDLSTLRETQWCNEFEELMRNRLVFGTFRYGVFGEKGKPVFDSVGSAIKRLQAYQDDGNLEHLVDAANLCLVEYVEGQHPKRHFEASDENNKFHAQISGERR